MRFEQLDTEAKEFLSDLARRYADKVGEGIPVYLRVGNDAQFIEDFVLPVGANKDFEAGAAEHNLYRGGATVLVRAPQGLVVTYDDRYRWWKPIAGIARFAEGADLLQTAIRELMEELWVISVFDKQQKRYVPRGQGGADSNCYLGFHAQVVELETEVQILGHSFNDKNRAYECTARWDIAGIPGEFSCISQEESFLPGHFGIVYAALDDTGKLVGYFSGQQGFVPAGTKKLHPSLAGIL